MCNHKTIKMIKAILFFVFGFCLSTPALALEGIVAPLPVQKASQESVTIDFNEVDIRLVIKYLSELTQSNFVIDREVEGKVSVVSPQKMSIDQARKVLETLLSMNGYSIVESDGIKRIVPSDTARQSQMQTWIGKEPPQSESEAKMVTQIVPLDYANPMKVKEVLEPHITNAGHISIYSPTNTLIITETTSNLVKLLSIVRSLDSQAPTARDDLRLISLKNANAKDVASVLTTLFEEQKRQNSLRDRASKGDLYSPPSIVAHEGTNSLIVTASPQDYAIVEKTVKQMDVLKDQVYVEVMIVEMTLEKVAEYGLEFAQIEGYVYGSDAGFAGVSRGDSIFEGVLEGGNLPGKVVGGYRREYDGGRNSSPQCLLFVKGV